MWPLVPENSTVPDCASRVLTLNFNFFSLWRAFSCYLNVFLLYFQVTKFTRVCSAHFLEGDYKKTFLGLPTNLLKPNAVPSVFSWTQTRKSRKLPKVRVKEYTLCSSTCCLATVPQWRTGNLGNAWWAALLCLFLVQRDALLIMPGTL